MLRNATFRLSRNKDSGDGDLDPIVELATPSGSLSSGSRMCEGQRCPPDRIPFKSLDPPTQQKQVIVDVNGRNRMLLPSPMDQRKSTTPPMSKNSLFTNFEDVRLTDEEHVYLCAAGQGDVPILRQSLEEAGPSLNVNCVDYMGRSALHLSVDSENIEAVELLMEKIDFNCIEESLLHAISKGATKIVRAMIEHPSYMAEAEKNQRKQKDPFFRTDEKSQFSPDIDPLLLAAHQNNHEIIQLFLSRNFVIQKPHPISCQCADCVTKQNYDSLKRSRSRLNAYRALASPAYMALSSTDPIMTTFELRQEMKKLAQVEKEFKNEYLSLVEQCMTFACELMDLCRGTQEVEAVLSEADEDNGVCDPLARLKFAIEYEEKKFVAHPNCQQHLTNIWYGPEMGFMQSLNFWKKIAMWITCIPLVPIFCILYVVAPGTKVGHALRCPASKFITHTLSHTCFLILLAAATFRLEEKTRIIANTTAAPALDLFDPACRPEEDDICRDKIDKLLKDSFRPANTLITNVQICLMFWIIGLLWIECKQIYNVGLRIYLLDNYNWMDFVILSLYMSSYFLRYLVDHWIKEADLHYNGTARAKEALFNHDVNVYKSIETQIFNDVSHKTHSYFMKALRFDWHSNDPEIVSDVLFAIANVLSIARTTFLMPAFEVLGPLQISLGRMLGDITRFLVLFTLVLFAFMVGLHNLYWYYGSQTYAVPKKDSKTDKLVHTSEAFQGLPRTLYSLFWSMFGLIPIDSVEIKYPKKELSSQYANNFPGGSHATSIVEGVGMFLFALYHVAIIIVLTNMLIAMMSHSFEAIQGDCDVEWKFARTKLWMNYIDEGSTLPVPFNMLPTPKSFRFAWRFLKIACSSSDQALLGYKSRKRQTFIEIQRERVCQMLQIEMPQTSYKEILQRLVKRYLFKLERMKEEGKEVVNPGTDSYLTTASQPGDGNANYASEIAIDASEDETDESHRSKPTSSTSASDTNPSRLNLWRQDAPNKQNQPHQPPPPPSCGGTRLLRRTSRPSSVSSQFQPNQIQLVSLPQLDLVQRSLKVLDVRVQRLHTLAKEEDRLRQDTEHVLLVISENRKALGNVLLVLTSVQDEVRNLALAMKKQQSNTFTIRPPTTRGRLDSKRDSNLEMSSTGHVLPF